eukprot:scaffold242664_cov15-Tisochrysis_lutea.AAC.1
MHHRQDGLFHGQPGAAVGEHSQQLWHLQQRAQGFLTSRGPAVVAAKALLSRHLCLRILHKNRNATQSEGSSKQLVPQDPL